MSNLFADLPARLDAEVFDILVASEMVRIERIVSTGHATPDGTWCEQTTSEWVVVLRGSAGLRFEGDAHSRTLGVGDHVLIPAHVRHRVEWTAAREPTVWLAVHFRQGV